MDSLITFAVYVLATARITRLVIDDELVRGPRRWWLAHAPAGSLRRYWITCAWCVSIAAAAAPAACWVFIPDSPWAKACAAVLALSFLTVILRHVEAAAYGKAVMFAPAAPATTEAEGEN